MFLVDEILADCSQNCQSAQNKFPSKISGYTVIKFLCNQSRFKISEIASNKHKLISNIPQLLETNVVHVGRVAVYIGYVCGQDR